jgi:large subunit ribosomal protein L31
MKKNIHPQWHQTQVTCVCGNTFELGSTLEKIEVDICSKCHPFFTGETRFADREGRIDRFRKAVASAQANPARAKKSKTRQEVKSFKEVLSETAAVAKAA